MRLVMDITTRYNSGSSKKPAEAELAGSEVESRVKPLDLDTPGSSSLVDERKKSLSELASEPGPVLGQSGDDVAAVKEAADRKKEWEEFRKDVREKANLDTEDEPSPQKDDEEAETFAKSVQEMRVWGDDTPPPESTSEAPPTVRA